MAETAMSRWRGDTGKDLRSLSHPPTQLLSCFPWVLEHEAFAMAEDRAGRIRKVMQEVLRRRAAGESVRDEEILAAHPDLMPDLERHLRQGIVRRPVPVITQ